MSVDRNIYENPKQCRNATNTSLNWAVLQMLSTKLCNNGTFHKQNKMNGTATTRVQKCLVRAGNGSFSAKRVHSKLHGAMLSMANTDLPTHPSQ